MLANEDSMWPAKTAWSILQDERYRTEGARNTEPLISYLLRQTDRQTDIR